MGNNKLAGTGWGCGGILHWNLRSKWWDLDHLFNVSLLTSILGLPPRLGCFSQIFSSRFRLLPPFAFFLTSRVRGVFWCASCLFVRPQDPSLLGSAGVDHNFYFLLQNSLYVQWYWQISQPQSICITNSLCRVWFVFFFSFLINRKFFVLLKMLFAHDSALQTTSKQRVYLLFMSSVIKNI